MRTLRTTGQLQGLAPAWPAHNGQLASLQESQKEIRFLTDQQAANIFCHTLDISEFHYSNNLKFAIIFYLPFFQGVFLIYKGLFDLS